jgi:hypothetical protein
VSRHHRHQLPFFGANDAAADNDAGAFVGAATEKPTAAAGRDPSVFPPAAAPLETT